MIQIFQLNRPIFTYCLGSQGKQGRADLCRAPGQKKKLCRAPLPWGQPFCPPSPCKYFFRRPGPLNISLPVLVNVRAKRLRKIAILGKIKSKVPLDQRFSIFKLSHLSPPLHGTEGKTFVKFPSSVFFYQCSQKAYK